MSVREPIGRYLSPDEAKRFYDRLGPAQDWQGFYVVVGFYGNSSNGFKTTHGYVLQNGVLTTYDVPNSISTTIWDISPGMVMVGTYVDNTGKQHGFLELPDGSAPITTDFPNAAGTVVQGINPGGAIVGQYSDTSGHTHGFLAVPATTN